MNGSLARSATLTLMAATLRPSLGTAQAGHAVASKTASGIPRLMSDGPTQWRDTTTWRLVLDHVVQPAAGAPGELGKPDGIALLPDGRLFITDESPTAIHLYDSSGKFVRPLGREGSGPGEYKSPFIVAGTRWLVVQDPELSRATLYTFTGTVIRSFTSSCCSYGPIPLVDANGHIATASFSMTNGVGHDGLLVFDSLGHRVDSLELPKAMVPLAWRSQTKNGSTAWAIPFSPSNVNLRLPDGSFVHGRTDRYELIASRNGRDTVRIFGRSGVLASPIAARRRDSVFHARVDRSPPLQAIARESDVPTTYNLWRTINRDGSGNFWIGRDGPPSDTPLFDIFSPAGAFLGSVVRPWVPAYLTSWAGDRVAVLDTDSDDLPRVRVFRIERRH
jgi:hypothetical protein